MGGKFKLSTRIDAWLSFFMWNYTIKSLSKFPKKIYEIWLAKHGRNREIEFQRKIYNRSLRYQFLFFLDILYIGCLWNLSGLTKLQLSNNMIEKIANINMLINLEELDLSFNSISRLEGLTNLAKLKIFSVFQNKISCLENMEQLSELQIFSAGNNNLTSDTCVSGNYNF